MKYLKVVVPLLVVLALLVIAMPAAAQGPTCPALYSNVWFVPAGCTPLRVTMSGQAKLPAPYVVKSGTNEDPFGGLPIWNGYGPLGNVGIESKFGLTPNSYKFGAPTADGGVPSQLSGDGTSPRKAINIEGAWSTSQSVRTDLGETPMEIPTCATIKIPAGSSRWFKFNVDGKSQKVQFWVDDELDNATTPSGSAVFGAADAYMYGVNGASGWAANSFDTVNTQTNYGPIASGPVLEGFVGVIYGREALQPNYEFNAPNAAILTLNSSATSGSLSRGPGETQASKDLPQINRSQRVDLSSASGLSLAGILGHPVSNLAYASYNFNQPNHLLWYESGGDGWYFARVYNQMLWDGVASVCSYRAFVRSVPTGK